jgi:hypothetical protein
MELCNRVVDALKKELKLPSLAVKLQAVTSQNRIPLVVKRHGRHGVRLDREQRRAAGSRSAFSDTTPSSSRPRFIKRARPDKPENDRRPERARSVAVGGGCRPATNTVKRGREFSDAGAASSGST